MLRPLFFALITACFLLLSAHAATAQCAVYYCAATGAIGYAASNDEDGHDPATLKARAHAMCEYQGGTRCALIYETNKLGWGGIIKGRDAANAPLVLTVGHQLTQSYAQAELERLYLAHDGIQFEDVLIITWKSE